MKASELIEKIHNKEIKSGTKIICHKKDEYFNYKIEVWFMGNWFSKVPPELHTSSSDFDKDMILRLCDKSVTYKIVDEEEIQELKNKRFTRNQKQIAGKINEVIRAVNELKKGK